MSAVFKTASNCVQSSIVGSNPTAPANKLKFINMTSEQIENFNKKNFPYLLKLKGNHIYLTKYLLEDLIEKTEDKVLTFDLTTAPYEVIMITKNSLITSLIIDQDVLFINPEND